MDRIGDIITAILSDKKLNETVTGIFIKCRKLLVSRVFFILFCCTKNYYIKFLQVKKNIAFS